MWTQIKQLGYIFQVHYNCGAIYWLAIDVSIMDMAVTQGLKFAEPTQSYYEDLKKQVLPQINLSEHFMEGQNIPQDLDMNYLERVLTV